ncbi:MAG TPA: hypothetical protein VME17_03435 [Bryobacteraceae bacterium]|nr:hypothetical protein [Bryobacteraceae bacterium]
MDAGTTAGQFGTLDLTSGAFTAINSSEPTLAGMATLDNNIEYGGDYESTPSNLYSIDPATGDLTTIGSSSVEYYDFGGTLSGLYAFDAAPYLSEFTLYSVDSTTGAATPVGLTGVLSTGESALSSDSNTLYLANNDTLYTVNTSTGAATSVGTLTNDAQFDALIVEDGVLYGYDGVNDTIDTINTSTGAVTLGPALTGLGPDVSIYGMASVPPISSVPEPRGEVLLLALAGTLSLWHFRRKSAKRPDSAT